MPVPSGILPPSLLSLFLTLPPSQISRSERREKSDEREESGHRGDDTV